MQNDDMNTDALVDRFDRVMELFEKNEKDTLDFDELCGKLDTHLNEVIIPFFKRREENSTDYKDTEKMWSVISSFAYLLNVAQRFREDAIGQFDKCPESDLQELGLCLGNVLYSIYLSAEQNDISSLEAIASYMSVAVDVAKINEKCSNEEILFHVLYEQKHDSIEKKRQIGFFQTTWLLVVLFNLIEACDLTVDDLMEENKKAFEI